MFRSKKKDQPEPAAEVVTENFSDLLRGGGAAGCSTSHDPNAVYIGGVYITNNPDLKFSDISDEEFRAYEFLRDNGRVDRLILPNPVALRVSSSGGHYVVTADGRTHYVPFQWKHLYWESKFGKPAVAF